MSKKQNIFVRSLHELKSTRCIAVTALLIAIKHLCRIQQVVLDLDGMAQFIQQALQFFLLAFRKPCSL